MTGGPDDTDDNPPPELKETVCWIVGLCIALGYLYVVYLTALTDFTLPVGTSLTVFAISMGLIYGIEPLTNLAHAWRGGGNQ